MRAPSEISHSENSEAQRFATRVCALDGESAMSLAITTRQPMMMREFLTSAKFSSWFSHLMKEKDLRPGLGESRFFTALRELAQDHSRRARRMRKICFPLLRLWHFGGSSWIGSVPTGHHFCVWQAVEDLSPENFPWWSRAHTWSSNVADRDILKTSNLKDHRQHHPRFRPKMLKHLQGRSHLSHHSNNTNNNDSNDDDNNKNNKP